MDRLDARRFGRMAYFSAARLPAELERFGADPLEISEPEFLGLLKSHKSRIKALLLDQSALRGVGSTEPGGTVDVSRDSESRGFGGAKCAIRVRSSSQNEPIEMRR